MTPSLLLVPLLSFALAAPAPPNDAPYAKVELQGQFRVEDSGSGEPAYLVWVHDGPAFKLDFGERKDLLNKDELKKIDGQTVLVKGELYLTGKPGGREAAIVVVKSFMPAKK